MGKWHGFDCNRTRQRRLAVLAVGRPSSTGTGGGRHLAGARWFKPQPPLELLFNLGPLHPLRMVLPCVPAGKVVQVVAASGMAGLAPRVDGEGAVDRRKVDDLAPRRRPGGGPKGSLRYDRGLERGVAVSADRNIGTVEDQVERADGAQGMVELESV